MVPWAPMRGDVFVDSQAALMGKEVQGARRQGAMGSRLLSPEGRGTCCALEEGSRKYGWDVQGTGLGSAAQEKGARLWGEARGP